MKLDHETSLYEVVSMQPRDGLSHSGPYFSSWDLVPHSVKRKVDGEVFTIGDRVSNGTPMCGRIMRFDAGKAVNNPQGEDITVFTDYSGVGMNMASLSKVPVLPSRFQQGDAVCIKFSSLSISRAVVIQVHFTHNKIRYDLEVWIGAGTSTRVYNIDEAIIEKA